MNVIHRKKSLNVNQVKIEFTKKPITAWGGICSIVAKYLERLDFRSWIESTIPIEEISNNGKGVYEKVLAQFLTVLTGGERFCHMSWWGYGGEAIKASFGVKWLPSSASTLTRFWGKIGFQSKADELLESARRLAGRIVSWEGITEDDLNLDSTVLVRYGNQQGAKKGYNPKKPGRPSHHPLLAFLGSGYMVNLWNRSGNTSSGYRAVEFFEQALLCLGPSFRVRRVLCDSGFYLVKFIEWLESKGFTYIIAAPISIVLQRRINALKEWRHVAKGIEAADFYFEHADEKWKKKRRYVVIRQLVSEREKASGKQPSLFKECDEWKNYRISLFITNDEKLSPEDVWRKYRPRANDENSIKNLKDGFGFGGFCMKNFWATEAVMAMNALVFFNLIHYLNRNVLNLKRPLQQLKTIRGKYFIIPAQLGGGGGVKVLRLAVGGKKMRAKLRYLMERIFLIEHSLNCIADEGG